MIEHAGAAPPRPRFLVLMAARNGATWIRAQIDSVLAQSGVDVVVLVRDDASEDSTREIVADLSRTDDRVRLHPDHAPKRSASANFFELIRVADGEDFDYVAFCDQDDEWLPHKLARAASQLRSSGRAGYSAAVRAQWQDGRSKVLSQSSAVRGADHLFEGAGQGCTFVMGPALFSTVRATLERRHALKAGLHYHDWTVYAIARSTGHEWFFDPEPTMLYRQHSLNDTGARNSGAGIARRIALIRSGWYRQQVAAIVDLATALQPGDELASTWARLTAGAARTSPVSRLRRCAFVLRHGRRKALDRAILAAAVIFGYL